MDWTVLQIRIRGLLSAFNFICSSCVWAQMNVFKQSVAFSLYCHEVTLRCWWDVKIQKLTNSLLLLQKTKENQYDLLKHETL